jgi:hypothetical protein
LGSSQLEIGANDTSNVALAIFSQGKDAITPTLLLRALRFFLLLRALGGGFFGLLAGVL